jgi:membrane protein YdbS with pleckstrin-like domain
MSALERSAERMYRGLWAVLVHAFRVPAEPPTLPVEAGGFIESFQPAPAYLAYLKWWFWLVLLVTDIALTIGYLILAIVLIIEGLWWVALLLLPIALFIIVAPDIIAYVAIHLRYDTMWYVLTDRSMRIRRGVWQIRETTLTFENVQNVKLMQGPIERWFGIGSLEVQTAGGGSVAGPHGHGTSGGHHGVISGITDAPRVRDLILARVRSSRSAGLGDEPDSHHAATNASIGSPRHLAALREILAEARALRQT